MEILLGVIACVIVIAFLVWLVCVIVAFRQVRKIHKRVGRLELPDPFYSLETRTAPRNLHRAYA